MAKFGPTTVAIQIDDAPGGSLTDISAYVTSIGGIKVEQITEQTNPFGVAYEAHTPVGVQRVPDITLEGFYDNTASTGPHAVLSTVDDGVSDATRSFSFTPDGGKTFTMESRVVDYEVVAQLGALTRYRSTIRQAGAGAWA